MAYARNSWLFITRPDIFPQGYETETERWLWAKFYERRERESKRRGRG